MAIVYLPSLYGGFISDDMYLILNRTEHFENLDGWRHLAGNVYWWGTDRHEARQYLYRPWIATTYWLEYQLGGGSSFVFHFSNYLVHLANTGLAIAVLAPFAGMGTAAAVALLAGICPAALTSVGWIAGRTDLWATFFVLLFLLLFRRARRSRSWLAAVGAWLSLFLGLAAKEIALVAPLLAWVLERAERSSGSAVAKAKKPMPAVRSYALLLIPVLASVVLRRGVIGAVVPKEFGFHLVPHMVPLLPERILRTALSILVPVHYDFYCSSPWWSGSAQRGALFFVAWLFFAALVGLVAWGLRKRKLWGIGGAWFGISLLPVYLAGQAWNFLADFYAYLSLAGFWLFVIDGLRRLMKTHFPQFETTAWVRRGALGFAVVVLGILTAARLPILRSSYAMSSHTVEREPTSVHALIGLSDTYFAAGDGERGLALLARAAQLDPSHWEPHYRMARWNLEHLDVKAAAPHVDALAIVGPDNPDAQHMIARFYYEAGHCVEAVGTFRRAFSLDKPTGEMLFDYGLALICTEQYPEGVAVYQEVLKRRPRWARATNNLGICYENVGELERSVEAYSDAVRLDSALVETHASLAIVYGRLGEMDKARQEADVFFHRNPPADKAQRIRDQLAQLGVVTDDL